jgi:hypothetical protein
MRGVIHVVKSGGRRVDAPACHRPRKTLDNRIVRVDGQRDLAADVHHTGDSGRAACRNYDQQLAHESTLPKK